MAISKTKLLLRLDPNSEVFQSAEAGHQCEKCGFLLTEEMCSIVDDLPTLEKNIPIDTIAALIYIASYVIRKEEQMEDTYFLYVS